MTYKTHSRLIIVDAVSTHRFYTATIVNNQPFDRNQRHTFLLRFWYEPEQGCWRVYLQESEQGQERLFANLPELITFLAQKLTHSVDGTSS